jgi:hypothetical protein
MNDLVDRLATTAARAQQAASAGLGATAGGSQAATAGGS